MKPASAFKIVFIVALVAAAGGGFFYQYERAPESSPVSRGAHLATTAGCFACHGLGAEDPRTNYRLGSNDAWRSRGIDPIWEEGLLEADEVIEWITHGVPERRRERHQQLLLRMPAYGDDGHLSPREINDIAAWSLAEAVRRSHRPARFEPLPDVAAVAALSDDDLIRRGDALARDSGCYQCHGELGQGAVSNLASFKGYIPGFQGDDFLALTADGDREEVRYWIEHGRGRALESGPLGGLASRYLDQQAIPMPAYADIFDDVETEILVSYLLLLNRMGPLDAQGVEALAITLISDSE
ncbi:cytochrome c [Actomonas aquatica]|uniref:C-type cytochrome n=1 Tax=Actomonas aquatica TaxID=2866162 RepID=A0ABZ1CE51_9BACT|nr:c-type cytochrome [Opitutus sp. WL0086]WRQ89513.1 c-type cytochrome [Opitutus sp. WL0086]